MTDPETLALGTTVISGKSYADDFISALSISAARLIYMAASFRNSLASERRR